MAMKTIYPEARWLHINADASFDLKVGHYTVSFDAGQYKVDTQSSDVQDIEITDSADVHFYWFPFPVFF